MNGQESSEFFQVFVLEGRQGAYCPYWLTKWHITKEKKNCKKNLRELLKRGYLWEIGIGVRSGRYYCARETKKDL